VQSLRALTLFDSLDRTGFYTGAAVDAGIGIDHANITLFADSFDRTCRITCSAVDAFIIDLISHRYHLLLGQYFIYRKIGLSLHYFFFNVHLKAVFLLN
jgi:hypothetical protein